MGKYRTLLFDADDTLLDFKRSEHSALSDSLVKFGIRPDDSAISVYSEINAELWRALERGEIGKERLRDRRFEIFCETMGYGIDPLAISKTYAEKLAEKSFVIPGVTEMCERLSGKYSLYVITNGIKTIQSRRFAASGLAPFFKRSFISEEVGYEKPDARYFDAVSAMIPGFEKETTLVIGDSLTSDIRGGINYGLDTCWFNRYGKEKPDEMNITYVINEITKLEELL